MGREAEGWFVHLLADEVCLCCKATNLARCHIHAWRNIELLLSTGPCTFTQIHVRSICGTACAAHEKGAKVQVNVPLEFVGESPAVKGGGNLVKALHDIEIKVAPKDLPKSLDVDITGLVDFTIRVLAKDIKLPESAELVTKEDEVVALVAEAVEEVIEEVVVPDLDSIEVEKKGKEEEAGAEGGEKAAEEKKEDK